MSARNIKLVISYDGSRYRGWQVQPDCLTVQEVIETAIEKLTGETTRLANAGRTDTGVHALGQVANFRTASTIPAEKFRPALQAHLPGDVVIRESSEVPVEFHAGYDAKWKLYRYILLNSLIPNPHLNSLVTRIVGQLNVDAMNRAAASLIGEHDFRSFESHYPNKVTSVRNVMYCAVREGAPWSIWQAGADSHSFLHDDSRFIYLDIVANGFLYNMVRAIMGTLLKIGAGDWPVESAAEILKGLDRKQAGPTAPPEGLYLMHVEYEREYDHGFFES